MVRIGRHLLIMRGLETAALVAFVAATAAVFTLPRQESLLAKPLVITGFALVMGLWFVFTAERDARTRLAAIRSDFHGHGRLEQLLRDYVLVFCVVLIRLGAVVGCGFIASIWGKGPLVGAPFMVLAILLTLRAWPTRHKVELLLERSGIRRDTPASG